MKSDKTTQAFAAARRELIGRNVPTSYRNPLHIVRASMQYLFDETGRRYIDGYMREAGVPIGTDGRHHNVLKIRPPMPFADEDADGLADALDRALVSSARVV